MKKALAATLTLTLIIPFFTLAQTRDRGSRQTITEVIPASNADLEGITSRASRILEIASRCDEYLCPDVDCEGGFALLESLLFAESILDETLRALIEAERAANAHHKSLVAQGGISAANLANVKGAIILHKTLHDIGSGLLDLASVVNFLEGIKDLPTAPGPQQLSDIYEVLKDFESLLNNLLRNLGILESEVQPVGSALPDVIRLAEAVGLIAPGEGIDKLKANINDIVSQLTDAVNVINELRNIYRAGGTGPQISEKWANVRGAIGQMVGRILKAYSNQVLEDRRARLRATAQSLVAEGEAAQSAYAELLRISERQLAAEKALKAVRQARIALAACLAKWCGSKSLSRPVIPSFIDTYRDANNDISFYSWGRALTWLNPQITSASNRLSSGFTINEGDCRENQIILNPGLDPTSCPPCLELARAFKIELEEYGQLLRTPEKDRPANFRQVLEDNRRDVSDAMAELRECERLHCPPSKPTARDFNDIIAAYPQIDREKLYDTDCDPCQPIVDQLNEAEAERQFYEAEKARIMEAIRRTRELDIERGRLERQAERLNERIQRIPPGFENRVNKAALQGELLDLTTEIRRLTQEIERLDAHISTLRTVNERLEAITERIKTLTFYLRQCEEDNCPDKDQITFIGVHGVTPQTTEGDVFSRPGVDRELTPGAGPAPQPQPPMMRSADLSLTKNASSSTVSAGGMLQYDLGGLNLGPDRAENVTVTDTLPSGINFRDVSTTKGTCSGSGVTIRCEVGFLLPNESFNVRIGTDVSSTATGTQTNNASISSPTPDPVSTNNFGFVSVMIAVSTPVDLSLTKSVSPGTVDPGGNIDYTITVRNNSQANATGVTVTDSVPAGVTVQGTSSTRGLCTQSGGQVSCDVGTLAGGASATITVNGTVSPDAGGTLNNTAQVSGAQNDPNSANNTASASATVRPPAPQQADLGITKQALSTTVQPGGQASYNLNASNAGPANATGVRVTDSIPQGFTFTGSNSSQGSCSQSGAEVRCDVGSLNAGGAAAIRLDFMVGPTVSGTVSNTATITGQQNDPSAGNNTSTSSVNVQRPSCALGIPPGSYTGVGGNCGAQGPVTASCNSPMEIVLMNPNLNLTCDQGGNCGDNNIIFGLPNHRCQISAVGPGFSVFCQRLEGGQPVAECRQNFSP